VIDYETVVAKIRTMVGKRVSVRVTSTDPNLTLASLVGVVSGGHSQTSLEAGGEEEGVVFTVETAPERHPESSFSIWRHPAGVGSIDNDQAGWRIGSSVIVVQLFPNAYGFPSA
jgi:hypothetical protein